MNKPQNVPTESHLPSLPRDEDGPVFNEPWEAEAFAMTLNLHAQGHFTWPEWAERLGVEISAARDAGDADRGGRAGGVCSHGSRTLRGCSDSLLAIIELSLLIHPLTTFCFCGCSG